MCIETLLKIWSPETQGCLLIHFSVVKFNFSQIIFLKKYSKHKFARILKLQFLGDSKKVSMPINSSLMPSPKVYVQIPKVKTPAFAFTDSAYHWVVLKGQISPKFPCLGETSLVNVISHPYFLVVDIHFNNTFLQIDLNFL